MGSLAKYGPLSSSPQMVTRNCSLRAPNAASESKFPSKPNQIISSIFSTLSYLFTSFFLVVFQMKTEIDNSFLFLSFLKCHFFIGNIYLFMNGKRTGRLLPQK